MTGFYAATEGAGTGVTAKEWLARPGSVGRAWPGSEVRLLGDNGEDPPVGEPGLLPGTIDYVAELPRDPSGKLYRRRPRDPYWSACLGTPWLT